MTCRPTCLPAQRFQVPIGRFGRDSRVLIAVPTVKWYRLCHSTALSSIPKCFMHRIVEEAADAGAGNARRCRFQIQDLTNQPCLPEQAAVGPVAFLIQRAGEIRDHAKAEGALAGDGLKAAQLRRFAFQIAGAQPEQGQRAIRDRFPGEIRRADGAQALFGVGIADQGIMPAFKPFDTVDEQEQRQPWRPGKGVPWHPVRIRQDSGQYPVEGAKAQGLAGVHSHHAAPRTDHLGCRAGGAGQGRRFYSPAGSEGRHRKAWRSP